MARVALLCPDLLFGSNVEGALRAAGHEVTRYGDAGEALEAAPASDVLVVDLNAVGVEAQPVEGVPAIGFYSHVDQEARRRAEAAGFDVVVPRSRMARETAAVVARALDT
jgi:CheY-like chemotaxis protein